MRPYGQRMGESDFAPCECPTCSQHRTPPPRAEVAREKVRADTEATMRRVMDKWLRGS